MRQAEHRGLIDAATEGDAELVAWRLEAISPP